MTEERGWIWDEAGVEVVMHGLKEGVIEEVLESRPNALDWSSGGKGNNDNDLELRSHYRLKALRITCALTTHMSLSSSTITKPVSDGPASYLNLPFSPPAC
jgi:hypothetical protein